MSLKDNVLRIILSFSLLLFAVACQEVYSQDLVLFDFEEDSELDRFQWSCRTLSELTDQHAAHGARSLKVDMYPAVYPGVTAKLDNHDWRGYKALQIDIFNPQNKEVRLTVRIDDRRKYPPDGTAIIIHIRYHLGPRNYGSSLTVYEQAIQKE